MKSRYIHVFLWKTKQETQLSFSLQRRLEELLEVYPDEPVQSQRFLKISKALGTRTTKQVASRVQKYFIKLAKLGLPVPGRVSIPVSHCLLLFVISI